MIYLSRSKNGKLMLCQKKPSHWVKVYSNSHKKRYDENAWNCGQVFVLDNEISGSELIPSADDNGNMYCVAVELFYIPQGATPNTKESQWLNKLWVTRERTGFMMLHHKEQPTRMRDSAEWKYKMSRYKEDVARGYYKWDCRIKKDGKKWTSWKGHFRFASEFKGSKNIEFDDEFPSKVGLRIPKEIIMPFNEWFNNHRELYHRPYIENKVELIQCPKPKDYHE